MNTESLYFIAIIPPAEIENELQKMKEYFRDEYNSKASLNSPPHITLHMPFKYREDREKKIEYALTEAVKEHRTFKIELKNFDVFEPRVIFADVMENVQLNALQSSVIKNFRQILKLDSGNYKERVYHPHLTLAFRDLRKAEFYRAWTEFKNKEYYAYFEVEEVWILKHDGKKWQKHIALSIAADDVNV